MKCFTSSLRLLYAYLADCLIVGSSDSKTRLLPSGMDQESNGASVELPTYSMGHPFRGKALIFNNETFKHGPARPGTEQDVANLRTCLGKLGFDVKEEKDVTHAEMRERITRASSEDYRDDDCFLCVFLSHGNDGVIAGIDSVGDGNSTDVKETSTFVRLQEDVFDQFRGDKCKTLVGKPKIFIIQACRGLVLEEGVLQTDARPTGPNVEEGSQPTIPSGADFIICYATSKGFVSFRNPYKGSWYINELCKQLNEFGQDEEINTILTRVHNKVSQRSIEDPKNPELCGKKQMPCFISMLTKQLIFKPKARL